MPLGTTIISRRRAEFPEDMTHQELAAILADFRKLYGMSQKGVGDLLDIDKRTVLRWLAGSTPVTRTAAITLRAISRIGLGKLTTMVRSPVVTPA